MIVWDLLAFPMTGAATSEVRAKEEIGLGDEVFLTGLFERHYGTTRNIPILRTGAIAAMPEEPIYWTRTTVEGDRAVSMDAYLIEARSIGGLSGSPVFVYVGSTRRTGSGAVAIRAGRTYYLLGLMHGHWDAPPDALSDSDEMRAEAVNMGIGIVVPVEAIMETLNHPKLKRRVTSPVRLGFRLWTVCPVARPAGSGRLLGDLRTPLGGEPGCPCSAAPESAMPGTLSRSPGRLSRWS